MIEFLTIDVVYEIIFSVMIRVCEFIQDPRYVEGPHCILIL